MKREERLRKARLKSLLWDTQYRHIDRWGTSVKRGKLMLGNIWGMDLRQRGLRGRRFTLLFSMFGNGVPPYTIKEIFQLRWPGIDMNTIDSELKRIETDHYKYKYYDIMLDKWL